MQGKHMGYEGVGLENKRKEREKEYSIQKSGMTCLGDPRRPHVDCSQHAMGYVQRAHLLSGAM